MEDWLDGRKEEKVRVEIGSGNAKKDDMEKMIEMLNWKYDNLKEIALFFYKCPELTQDIFEEFLNTFWK